MRDSGDLEVESGALKAEGQRRVASDGVSDHVGRVEGEFFAFGYGQLVDLAWGSQSDEAATGNVGGAPVGRGQTVLDARRDADGMACPGKQGVALGDHVIGGSVEVEDREASVGRLGAY